MISDAMQPKWNFFLNHFNQMSEIYRQLKFSLNDNKTSLKGFQAFLNYEGGERWCESEKIAKCIMDSNKSAILTEAPKPKNEFNNIQEIFEYASDIELKTCNAINNAISEAVDAKDYYTEMKFKEMYMTTLKEKKEVNDIHKKLIMYNGDLAALLEIDKYLYEKYSDNH